MPEPEHPFLGTRTTRAGLLARVTVAPHHVNHHLEHHLLMTVPHYRLPALHALLRARGVLPEASLAGSYGEVIRAVTTPA
jgi:fatty acid desaturase